jgi:AhpD family alkylhydroperoxidase
MTKRMNIQELVPAGYAAVAGLEKYVTAAVEPTVLELIKLRASILNGCSFCVDMHSRDALAAGEDSRRLFGVAAWHESPLFTERERAALALTDEVTRLGQHGVSDGVWEQVCAVWSAEEVANLVLAAATINVWNRIAITSQTPPPAAV